MEHCGDDIDGYECHLVLHQLQRSSREELNGCNTIADDILVFGCGETSEEALEDHDFNLQNVLERCQEKAIKLNGAKVQFRCEEVSYMGHTLTKYNLKPDARKVKAVKEMPPPTDKKGV